MAKKSMINRETKRAKTVAKYAKKRAELKATIANLNLSDDERWEAQLKFQAVSYTHLTLPTTPYV